MTEVSARHFLYSWHPLPVESVAKPLNGMADLRLFLFIFSFFLRMTMVWSGYALGGCSTFTQLSLSAIMDTLSCSAMTSRLPWDIISVKVLTPVLVNNSTSYSTNGLGDQLNVMFRCCAGTTDLVLFKIKLLVRDTVRSLWSAVGCSSLFGKIAD